MSTLFKLCLLGIASCFATVHEGRAEDTLPSMTPDTIPKDIPSLWATFDSTKEPMEMNVLHEYEKEGVTVKMISYANDKIWDVANYHKQVENDEKQHGAAWHYDKITMIKDYFERNSQGVELEPNLHYGRSDLGVHELSLFIEVGTINLYKLYYNLLYLHVYKLIIVPSDDYLLEFSI